MVEDQLAKKKESTHAGTSSGIATLAGNEHLQGMGDGRQRQKSVHETTRLKAHRIARVIPKCVSTTISERGQAKYAYMNG